MNFDIGNTLIQLSYFASAVLFILGLRAMSSPTTARKGMLWAGIGMGMAVIATFIPNESTYLSDGELPKNFTVNMGLIFLAIAIGGAFSYRKARTVQMTDMPQLVAMLNGLGGCAAACVAAIAIMQQHAHSEITQAMAAFGAFIGGLAFTGSLVAWAKLDGRVKSSWQYAWIQPLNALIFLATIAAGVYMCINFQVWDVQMQVVVAVFFALAMLLGITVAMPIGGADMPVMISLFNALTGVAMAFDGVVLNNAAMIVAGVVVGSAGTMLTMMMAGAMNRKVLAIIFKKFGATGGEGGGGEVSGSMKETDGNDAAITMAYANRVVIVPGYGMAVAQAQHKVWELAALLQERDVDVKFAIHPVAGRMPGHMNVLLAEAGVPYDLIVDMDDINPEFPNTDVVIVIGANDVVNPIAKTNPDSPIYGMPILEAENAKNCIVVKRGKGTGFSGVENHLFYADNTRMLYGDAQKAISEIIAGVKVL